MALFRPATKTLYPSNLLLGCLCCLFLLVSGQTAFAAADVQPITFDDAPDPVAALGTVFYTVVAQNNDPKNPAEKPIVALTVPAGFEFVGSDSPANCNYAGAVPSNGDAADKVICDGWEFFLLTHHTLVFEMIAAATPGTYQITVTTEATNDSNPDNNSETVNTDVAESSDLELVGKTGSPDPIAAGGIATYKFEVKNNGPFKAKYLILSDTLPPGLTFFADDAASPTDQDSDWHCSAASQDITCTAKDLAVDAMTPSVFYFRVKVTSATTGAITNAASVSAKTLDHNPDNNSATDDIEVLEGTDMSIAKTVDTDPVIGGQPVQFTLTATNVGPMTAKGVQVVDTLPTGYTSISATTVPAGWNCGVSGVQVTCTGPDMNATVSADIVITATPPPISSPPCPAQEVLHQNTAQVSTTTTDPIADNDSVTVSYSVTPNTADLSISKNKSPNPVAQGKNVESTIVVTNNGPLEANPVQVVDILSLNETYVSYTGTDWTCNHNATNPGGTVTCTYNDLPLVAGADTPSLIITTNATGDGDPETVDTLENEACVDATNDALKCNNCSTGSVSSTPEHADVIVTKTTSDASIATTDNSFTYTITVFNDGPQTAEAVDFRDTIPQYTSAGPSGSRRPATTISASTTQGSCTVTAALVHCDLLDINDGSTVTVSITVSRPMRDGDLTNTASAYSTLTGDPDLTNNESSVGVVVSPIADVEVTEKAVTYSEQPGPILAGTIATYTIQVRNNGPSTAEDVVLTDLFSGEVFDYVGSSVAGEGSCNFSYTTLPGTLTCDLKDMDSATTKAITVRIRPDHTATVSGDWQIDNTATVSMTTADSNTNNNSQTVHLPITLGQADIAVEKTESPEFQEPIRYKNTGDYYIVYQLKISNRGPSLATGVEFTDNVTSVNPLQTPAQELEFIGDTVNADGTLDAFSLCAIAANSFPVDGTDQNILCKLNKDPARPDGELAAGEDYTRYLIFKILDAPNPLTGDSYHDELSATANETDPNLANNSEGENTTVRTIVDLELVKSGPACASPVDVEEHFDLTLTVTNHGPGLSPETTVVDNLPTGMVLTAKPYASHSGITVTCTGAADETSFSCGIDSDSTATDALVADTTVDIVITVPVKLATYPNNGKITNSATVSGLGPEPTSDTTNPNTDDHEVCVNEPATLGDFVWLDANANGIQDNGENGISGVVVNLYKVDKIVSSTTTDANGKYLFTFNNVNGTTYGVGFVRPGGYKFSPETGNLSDTDNSDANVSSGRTGTVTISNYGDELLYLDAGMYQLLSLGDRVWQDENANGIQDSLEPGIPGVAITLYSAGVDGIFWNGDDVQEGTATTDTDGKYLFSSLEPNNYAIQITPPAWVGYSASPIQTADPENNVNTDSNIDTTLSPPAGSHRSGAITLASQTEPVNDGDSDNNTNLTLDFGLVLPGSIGNYVWLDENSDGIQDAGEPGIANITIQLKNSGGNDVATTVTDTHGGYLFTGLTPGNYFIEVVQASLPAGLSQTTTYTNQNADFGNQNQSVSPGYSVSAGQNLTADFGYNWSPSTDVTGGNNNGAIGDRIWIDSDGDGIQDSSEVGVSGAVVTLYTAGADGLFWTGDDVTVTTANTDASGNYIFDDLAAGAYAVKVTSTGTSHDILSVNYTQTGDPDHFATDAASAPAGTADDDKSTFAIILAPGDTFVNVDFGYQPAGATLYDIGSLVWLNNNSDGSQSVSEPGIPGVTIGLQNASNKFIATTTTGTDGSYLFKDLPDADYKVIVIDSNNILNRLHISYDENDGTTNPDGEAPFTLSGADELLVNFGYTPDGPGNDPGLIGDTIFLDRNNSGAPDSGEGMEAVRVLLKKGGDIVAVTRTDRNGNYIFVGLANDTYSIEVDTTTLPAGLTNSEDPDGGGDSIASVTLTLAGGGFDLDQDFGYIATTAGSIGNFIWTDTNADGVFDSDGLDAGSAADDETPLEGIFVELYNDLNNNNLVDTGEPLLGTTSTDATGAYLFNRLPAGSYNIKVNDSANILEGYWHSLGTVNDDNNSQADFYPVDLGDGANILTADFGYYVKPGSTGDRVWQDEATYDGLFSNGTDSAIAAVTVYLDIIYPNGTAITVHAVTDNNGQYLFPNLLLDENHNGIGSYGSGGDEPSHTLHIDSRTISTTLSNIHAVYGSNTDTTTVGGSQTDEDDQDTGSDFPAKEPAFPPMGGTDTTNDFGYFLPSSIGNYVWNDTDGDGIQDAGESGHQGISVHLLDGNGDPVTDPFHPGLSYVVNTGSAGEYLFTDLLPGNYQVQFIRPSNSSFSPANTGDDALDSDPNPTTGIVSVSLGVAEDNQTIDAGLIGPSINIEKSTNTVDADTPPGVSLNVGAAVNWSYVVTNTGIANLTQVTVTDDQIGAINCPKTEFTAGEFMTCTAAGTATAGQYANTATVIGTPPIGPAVYDTGPSHYMARSAAPAVDIEKATNGQDADTEPGPRIKIKKDVIWTYVVTNTGHFPLTNITVSDDQGVTVSCPNDTLTVGEAMTCTGNGIAMEGQYGNIGSVTGETPYSEMVQDTDPSHYFGKNFIFIPPSPCATMPISCSMIADFNTYNSNDSPLLKYTFRRDTLELVNWLGVQNVEAMTYSMDGKTLYATDGGVLGIVDQTPGIQNSFTPVDPAGTGRGSGAYGTISFHDIDGLAFDPKSGILYGTERYEEGDFDNMDLLLQIDPVSGHVIKNGFGHGVEYVIIDTEAAGVNIVDDIAFDPRTGTLYGVAGKGVGGGEDQGLIIDKKTGAVSLHAPILAPDGSPVQDMEGLTVYNHNYFYGTTGISISDVSTNNTLYRIDKSTGTTEAVTRLDNSVNGCEPSDIEAISCLPVCK